jgi:Phage integrase family
MRRVAGRVEALSADKATVVFHSLRRKAAGETARLHDLRHFVATQMIGPGHDIRTVAGRVGHGQPSTTSTSTQRFRAKDTAKPLTISAGYSRADTIRRWVAGASLAPYSTWRRTRMMIKGIPTETSSVFSAAATAVQQRGE